jgi:hypothetical protein
MAGGSKLHCEMVERGITCLMPRLYGRVRISLEVAIKSIDEVTLIEGRLS